MILDNEKFKIIRKQLIRGIKDTRDLSELRVFLIRNHKDLTEGNINISGISHEKPPKPTIQELPEKIKKIIRKEENKLNDTREFTASRKTISEEQQKRIISDIVDKVMITQIFYLLVPLIIIAFIIPIFNTIHLLIYGLPILFIIGIGLIPIFAIFYKKDYRSKNNWFFTPSFYLLLGIWSSFLMIFGIFFDQIVFGFQFSVYLTMTFLVSFLIGYPIGKWLKFSYKELRSIHKNLFIIGVIGFLVLTIGTGIFLIINTIFTGLSFSWFGNSMGGTIGLGILFIVFGALSMGILGVNMIIIDKLGNSGSINIWDKTDNNNILICLRSILIATFVGWVIILLIVAIIFSSDSGGSSDFDIPHFWSSNRRRRRYYRYRYYGYRYYYDSGDKKIKDKQQVKEEKKMKKNRRKIK